MGIEIHGELLSADGAQFGDFVHQNRLGDLVFEKLQFLRFEFIERLVSLGLVGELIILIVDNGDFFLYLNLDFDRFELDFLVI